MTIRFGETTLIADLPSGRDQYFGPLDVWSVASQADLSHIVNEFGQPRVVHNASRLSVGCPVLYTRTYIENLIRAGEPLSSTIALEVGKIVHKAIELASLGDLTLMELLNVVGNMWAALEGAIEAFADEGASPDYEAYAQAQREMALVYKWAAWTSQVLPLIYTRARTTFGAPMGLIRNESPIGVYEPNSRVLWVGIPDQVALWNDGAWAFENKSVAASRDVLAFVNAHHRSIQTKIQAIALTAWLPRLHRSGATDAPFAGMVYSCYKKVNLVEDPGEFVSPEPCKCGAVNWDEWNEDTEAALRTTHPRMKDLEAHWKDEQSATSRALNKWRKQKSDYSSWQQRVFTRDIRPLTFTQVSTMLLELLDLEYAKDAATGRNSRECYVFRPCLWNGDCEAPDVTREGIGQRQPDYVDAIKEGYWPESFEGEYEWSTNEEDSDGGQ